jgi:hypothetical protein
VETLTGLASAGVELVAPYVGQQPMQSHPQRLMLQVTAAPAVQAAFGADLDLLWAGDTESWLGQLLAQMVQVIERRYAPKLDQQGNIDFQLTQPAT